MRPARSKEEILRELAYKAWRFAANAYRLYPENKHTFSDYSNTIMKNHVIETIEELNAPAPLQDEYLDWLDKQMAEAEERTHNPDDFLKANLAELTRANLRIAREKYLELKQ